MKPYMKIGSFLLAFIMLFTVLLAGCTPISLNQEWSYKTNDKELAIGIYIYSLNTAYQQAKTYAEKIDDYDESKDDWLDFEITDDDGNKQVARKWIKEQAEKICLSYLVLEEQIKKEGVEIDQISIASADEQAEQYWNVGQYADYGYFMPMKDDLKGFGISLESFTYCTTEYNTKYNALFEKLYNKGGNKEVTDSELTKYFTENYVDYSYFSVNLYESTTDEAGSQSNVALSNEEAKKITDELDGYASDINGGKSYKDVMSDYMKANNVNSDPSTSNVEELEESSMGDELKNALKKLDSDKATTLKVGSGNSAVYYLVYKKDIDKDIEKYINDETNRLTVLNSMKSEEFANYIDKLAKDLKYEKNSSVIDKYDPGMFFVKPEPTTAAAVAANGS